MFQTHAPKSYWGEAMLIETYLINRMLSSILGSRVLWVFFPTIFQILTSLASLLLKFLGVLTLCIFMPVGPQALPTLLKAIAVRKGAYPSLIVHSPKHPRRTQGKLMDTVNPPICQQSPPQRHPWGSNLWPRLWYHL